MARYDGARSLVAVGGICCLASAGAAVINGCSDDDTSVPVNDAGAVDGARDGTVADAGQDRDGATQDVVTEDVATDGASDGSGDSGDAGGTVTTTIGTSGYGIIQPGSAAIAFREDDRIMRVSGTPECVIYVSSLTKPYSCAGTVTIGGDNVGQDGGPPAPVTKTCPTVPIYHFYLVSAGAGLSYYPADGTSSMSVLLSTTGTSTVPAVAVQTLHSPTFSGPVPVTLPASASDAGADSGAPYSVNHSGGFTFTWTNTSTDAGPASMMTVTLNHVVSETKVGDMHCSYPAAAGRATIPANVLTAFWKALQEGGSATPPSPSGFIRIILADWREVQVGTASYVFVLGGISDTSLGADQPFSFD